MPAATVSRLGFVHEDERAGGVAAGVRIGRDLAAKAQLYVSDVVQA